MAYKNPPKETRFPVNRPHAPNAGHKGPYLLPLLKKFLKKHITYEDPETQKTIKGTVEEAIVWRYILNACQGENQAIEGIFERLDGKVAQKLMGEGFDKGTQIIIVRPNENKRAKKKISSRLAS